MKSRLYLSVVVALAFAILVTACGSKAQPTPAPVEPTQPAPQIELPSPTLEPVMPTESLPTQQSFAPICQAGPVSCVAPDVKDIPVETTNCVKKIPYQYIEVPEGTLFQVLDPSGDFVCEEGGTTPDGKHFISCHGTQLYSFDLKLTNPSCSGSTLVDNGQCQSGYGFDSAQQCCAPLPTGGDAGSVTIKVNLGACP